MGKGNYYKIYRDICKDFYKLDIYKSLMGQIQLLNNQMVNKNKFEKFLYHYTY